MAALILLNSTRNMINVTMINDNVFELTESFGISLSLPDSASSRVTLAADPAQVTILDDDGQFPLVSSQACSQTAL